MKTVYVIGLCALCVDVGWITRERYGPTKPCKIWVSSWHNHIIVQKNQEGHLPIIKEWDAPPGSGVGQSVEIP